MAPALLPSTTLVQPPWKPASGPLHTTLPVPYITHIFMSVKTRSTYLHLRAAYRCPCVLVHRLLVARKKRKKVKVPDYLVKNAFYKFVVT